MILGPIVKPVWMPTVENGLFFSTLQNRSASLNLKQPTCHIPLRPLHGNKRHEKTCIPFAKVALF
jgi:hypothetical protein